MRNLAALALLTVVLSGCALFGGEEIEPAATTVPTTVVQTTIVNVPSTAFADEGINDIDLVGDPSIIDPANLDEVAGYVACGYFIREARAETSRDIVDRLAPFISDDLASAITLLRGNSDEIVTAQVGGVTRIRYQVYDVGCAMQAVTVTGERVQFADNVPLRIEEQEDGTHLVTQLTIGGLTLPDDLAERIAILEE